MKIKLKFEMENEYLPFSYHDVILSFIKKSLEEYNLKLYKKLYNKQDPIVKTFTFSVFFNEPIFLKNEIKLSNKKFDLNFSDYDVQNGLNLYNAFKLQLKKDFKIKNNVINLISVIGKLDKSIEKNNIIIKMLSPLIVREHNSINNQDIYYTFEHPDFNLKLKLNIENVISKLNLNLSVENFDVKPLKVRKTVIRAFNSYANASLGIFQIKANQDLLNFLSKAGLGSKRSSGFGHFKIIG